MGKIKGQVQYLKFKDGKPLSRKEAMLAHCYQCNGEEVSNMDCQGSNSCPLYQYSPYGCGKPKIVKSTSRKGQFSSVIKTLALCLATVFIASFSHADDSKAIITLVMEARGESFDGMVAVASVIKTRMYIKGKTSEEIVMKPHAFSCWKNGNPVQSHVPTSKELETARMAWNAAEVGMYTNYWATWGKTPYWAKYCRHNKRIGRHYFCKLENF